MKIFFLLIILTKNGAGDINASFVNTETLQQCEQKALMLEGVFGVSNIPVIESRCIQSDLKFSPFAHASNTSKIRHFYVVKLDKKSVQINSVSDWKLCMEQAKQGAEDSKIYCSSSVQSIEK